MRDTRGASLLPVILLTAAVLAGILCASCGPTPARSGNGGEKVAVAWSPYESNALFFVAQDRGFFASRGLDVVPRRFDTGSATLQAVEDASADLAVGATEFPLVTAALRGQRVRTVSCIARSEFIYVVARRDRGVLKPGDLRGKRIGTTFGTIAHFFLGRFLQLNGIGMDDVTLIDLKTPEEWVGAVASGTVDAVATAQPYASKARQRLGGNACWWSAQADRPLYALAIARDEWIPTHAGAIERFLGALSDAEDYVAANPTEARAIVARALEVDNAYAAQIWRQNDFELTLEQSLLISMEDEARWLIDSRLASATAMPDVTGLVYTDGLAKLRPDAVGIGR